MLAGGRFSQPRASGATFIINPKEQMTHSTRWRKLVTWSLIIASALCFVLVFGWIAATLEQLSEPYHHEGELESIRRAGIFWSIFFAVLGIVFIWCAARLSRKAG